MNCYSFTGRYLVLMFRKMLIYSSNETPLYHIFCGMCCSVACICTMDTRVKLLALDVIRLGFYLTYVCLYLIFVRFMRSRMSPGKIVFGVVPSKNYKRCPRKSGLSSLYLSPVKTIIAVPGKVVYCLLCLPLCRGRCLSFLLKLSRMATLLGKS